MNLAAFAYEHHFPQGKLYRDVRKFVDQVLEGTEETEVDFPERGFRIEVDAGRGRVGYTIYDEERFRRFALWQMDYAILTNAEIERLLQAARVAVKVTHGEGDYVAVQRETREPYRPKAEYWDEVRRILKKAG